MAFVLTWRLWKNFQGGSRVLNKEPVHHLHWMGGLGTYFLTLSLNSVSSCGSEDESLRVQNRTQWGLLVDLGTGLLCWFLL